MRFCASFVLGKFARPPGSPILARAKKIQGRPLVLQGRQLVLAYDRVQGVPKNIS